MRLGPLGTSVTAVGTAHMVVSGADVGSGIFVSYERI